MRGGIGAQCGLIEGGLMFIGIYCSRLDKEEKEIISTCYHFAEVFTQKFGYKKGQ